MTSSAPLTSNTIVIRSDVIPADVEAVRRLATSTGFFAAAEIDVAVELVEERLRRGEASGYHFWFAEENAIAIGYACYGPIACTDASWDLYWIVVDAAAHGRGVGKALLAKTEQSVRAMGGKRLYIETAGREQYAPTRAFYLRRGYACEAKLADFYAPDDDKWIFVKSPL
jgi:GNAT superfamily N-acetyltransferase